jgi:hypothetical protein
LAVTVAGRAKGLLPFGNQQSKGGLWMMLMVVCNSGETKYAMWELGSKEREMQTRLPLS